MGSQSSTKGVVGVVSGGELGVVGGGELGVVGGGELGVVGCGESRCAPVPDAARCSNSVVGVVGSEKLGTGEGDDCEYDLGPRDPDRAGEGVAKAVGVQLSLAGPL